jgi:HSP20 family molecular chaperone IbpA
LQKQIVWQKRKYAFYAKRYNEGSIMSIIESAARNLSRELDRRSREFYECVLPSIDMYEDGNDLVIDVDLPGFAKENIFLRVTDDILSIKARKKETRRDEEYPCSNRQKNNLTLFHKRRRRREGGWNGNICRRCR